MEGIDSRVVNTAVMAHPKANCHCITVVSYLLQDIEACNCGSVCYRPFRMNVYVHNTFVIVSWHLAYLKECSMLLMDCTNGGERRYERSKITLFSTFTLLLCEHFTSVSQS